MVQYGKKHPLRQCVCSFVWKLLLVKSTIFHKCIKCTEYVRVTYLVCILYENVITSVGQCKLMSDLSLFLVLVIVVSGADFVLPYYDNYTWYLYMALGDQCPVDRMNSIYISRLYILILN